MIRKEFNCATCGDFESGIAICPRCGGTATRVFRTPVGLGFGRAKRIDRVIEGEFERRGISNYTNAGSAPRVDYGTGEYNGIRAGWGKSQLSAIQQQYAPMMSQPLVPPALPGGVANPNVPTVDMGSRTPSQGWGAQVPTEVMDLKPNT